MTGPHEPLEPVQEEGADRGMDRRHVIGMILCCLPMVALIVWAVVANR